MQPVKDAIKSGYSSLMWDSGALRTWLRVRPGRRNVVVLNYHAIDGRVFEDHLRYLTAAYGVVDLARALAHVRGESALPDNSVVITFDDAYRQFADQIYPLLRAHAVPATMFVPTDSVDQQAVLWFNRVKAAILGSEGRPLALGDLSIGPSDERRTAYRRAIAYLNSLDIRHRDDLLDGCLDGARLDSACLDRHRPLTWDQMRSMRDWVTFGAHSASHPNLRVVEGDRLGHEVWHSRARVEAELGDGASHFAYPFGRPEHVGDAAAEAVRRAGGSCGLTTVRGACRVGEDVFHLPRVVCDGIGSGRVLATRLSDLWVCLST